MRHRTGLDLNHFQQRMAQSHPELPIPKTLEDLKVLLRDRIKQLNIQDAKSDVSPFIKDNSELNIWSHAYFNQITEQVVQNGVTEYELYQALVKQTDELQSENRRL